MDSVIEVVPANTTEYAVLSGFFAELINNLMVRHSVLEHEVKLTIELLWLNCTKKKGDQLKKDMDYSGILRCISYLHLFAANHSYLVRETMGDVIRNSPSDVIMRMLVRMNLDVTFLGSGPGNDFIGFLYALYGRHKVIHNMNVTAVDCNAMWKEVFFAVIDKLRKGECGKAGDIFQEMNVQASFLAADITNETTWCAEMRTALERSDLVFCVRVLSNISKQHQLIALTNVVRCMKRDAVLVYIDYPFPTDHFQSLQVYMKAFYLSLDRVFSFRSAKRFGYTTPCATRADVRLFLKK